MDIKKDEIQNLNVEALVAYQKSPFAFIEDALGEVPQPIKPEFRTHVLRLYTVPAHQFSEYAKTIKKEMFEPFIKGRHLTWQQTIVVIAVQRAVNGSLPRRIAVKAGRGVGKSNITSKLLLWYLFSFPESKIPCTAPTADQLFSVLWSEVNMVLANMKPEYAAMFEWQSNFIRVKGFEAFWYARAKTAAKGETGALSGVHCFEEGTVEVMTKDGFKDFKNVTQNDKVMTRLGWQNPSEVIREKYEGEMITQHGMLWSFSVTPEHKFPSLIRNSHYLDNDLPQWKEEKLVAVKDWGKRTVKVPRYITADYGHEQNTYIIPEYKNHYKSQPSKKERVVKMDDWVAFVAWYLAEGSCNKTSVGIAQSLKNQVKRDEIAAIINRLGFTPSISGKNAIYLCNTQVVDHIKRICPGKAHTKRVPEFVFNLSKRQINIFLDAYMKGDGSVEKSGRVSYVTSSKGMANDLQRLILLAGRYATISIAAKKGSLMNVGDKYGLRNQNVFCVKEWNTNSNLHAVSKSSQRKIKHYKGTVECLTVPSGMFYVRDKKTSQGFWTGNSDYMFTIADEAYDVEDEVFHIAEATQTGLMSLMLLIGNAVHDHGYFYDCFNKNSDEWITLTLNGEESPIVNPQVIIDQEKLHGRGSNHYRASILGEFPTATAIDVEGWYRMFTDDWLNSVIPQDPDALPIDYFDDKKFQLERSFMGVDPAGEGTDEAAGYIRSSLAARLLFSSDKIGVKGCAANINGAITLFDIEPSDISCDNFGVGAELSQEVALLSNGENYINGINVGDQCEEILDKAAYQNERARLYDMILWWGKRGGKILYDEKLRNELKTIFAKNEKGKLYIMPKKEMRRRGFKSPNRADALMLTFPRDYMMSNYIPRAGFKAVTVNKMAGQKKSEEQFDRYNSIPSF